MFQKVKSLPSGNETVVVKRLSDGATIPFDPDNTDYANFKRDIEDGAELQDADGNVMSADAAKEFIKTLP